MLSEKFLISVLLIVGATRINGARQVQQIKGRLLTPEEGCGVSEATHNRIVGGGPAKNGGWPWMALLGEPITWSEGVYYNFPCAGSLITSRHVLSAAHCFKMDKNYDIVRLGEYDIASLDDGEHVDIPIDHFDMHTNHSSYLVFNTLDIALVWLKRDAEFNDRIRPICLPEHPDIVSLRLVDKNAFVAGWGRLGENDNKAWVLQEVQVPIMSKTDCKERYRKLYREYKYEVQDYRFDENFIVCAGYPDGGKDSCQGDSGGPLMLAMPENNGYCYHQLGIVSSGFGCARANAAGMYTNVQHQLDWIKERLN